jgi:hypothetical protein
MSCDPDTDDSNRQRHSGQSGAAVLAQRPHFRQHKAMHSADDQAGNNEDGNNVAIWHLSAGAGFIAPDRSCTGVLV